MSAITFAYFVATDVLVSDSTLQRGDVVCTFDDASYDLPFALELAHDDDLFADLDVDYIPANTPA